MGRVHVYPVTTRNGKRMQSSHRTGRSADCWCEPRIENHGTDAGGGPALVYVHSDRQDWRRAQKRKKK